MSSKKSFQKLAQFHLDAWSEAESRLDALWPEGPETLDPRKVAAYQDFAESATRGHFNRDLFETFAVATGAIPEQTEFHAAYFYHQSAAVEQARALFRADHR